MQRFGLRCRVSNVVDVPAHQRPRHWGFTTVQVAQLSSNESTRGTPRYLLTELEFISRRGM